MFRNKFCFISWSPRFSSSSLYRSGFDQSSSISCWALFHQLFFVFKKKLVVWWIQTLRLQAPEALDPPILQHPEEIPSDPNVCFSSWIILWVSILFLFFLLSCLSNLVPRCSSCKFGQLDLNCKVMFFCPSRELFHPQASWLSIVNCRNWFLVQLLCFPVLMHMLDQLAGFPNIWSCINYTPCVLLKFRVDVFGFFTFTTSCSRSYFWSVIILSSGFYLGCLLL